MLEDILYPDNKYRSARATQLANDCELLASNLNIQKEQVDIALAAAAEAYQKAYQASGIKNFKREDIRLARSWTYEAPAVFAGIVASIMIERALQQAFTRYLVGRGRIGEAAFARLVGLPRWFKVGKFAGTFAGAMVVTLLVQLGIDAVDGALQRKKLREAIESLSTPRFRMQRAVLLNAELIGVLKGLVTAYNTFSVMIGKMEMSDTIKQTMLDNFTKTSMEEAQKQFEKITADTVLQYLANSDRSRESWLDEDSKPDTSLEQPTIEDAITLAFSTDDED